MIKSVLILAAGFFSFVGARAMAAETASGAALNDGQIAKVVMTVDEGEIDASEMALKKTKNSQVKDLAKMMVDQHKQNKKDTKSVVSKNKLDTKDSEVYETVKENNKAVAKDLKDADKNAFDKKYVDDMVDGHQKALALLDDKLIPAAQNSALKDHLNKTRTAVQTHLDHAKQLQSSLQ